MILRRLAVLRAASVPRVLLIFTMLAASAICWEVLDAARVGANHRGSGSGSGSGVGRRATVDITANESGGGGSVHKEMRSERERDAMMMMGSRPPTCASKCNRCHPCEAVQVPTNPALRAAADRLSNVNHPSSLYSSSSNYKPEDWKCACGNRLYNP